MTAGRRVVVPLVVVVVFVVVGVGLSALTSGSLAAVRVSSPTFDDLTVAAAAVLAWLLFACLALGAVLPLLAALPGVIGAACGALAGALTPRAYRRVVQLALGLTVMAGPGFGSVMANATPGDAPSPAGTTSVLNLDRPGLHRPGTATAPRATDHYAVRPGDCLWHIARRHLGIGATSPEITAEWHRWYHANRDVIGDDPDVILVGQVLRVPGPPAPTAGPPTVPPPTDSGATR